MTRVVFLDIDGVVNTFQIYKEPPSHIPESQLRLHDGYYVDMCNTSSLRVSNIQAVTYLDKMCHEFNLKIVISSTWRCNFEKVKQSLYNSGLSKDIEIIGKTGPHEETRGLEICRWLDEHGKEIDDFIILDDDSDMFPLHKHLIKTNTYAGITIETYQSVISYFNNKPLGSVDPKRLRYPHSKEGDIILEHYRVLRRLPNRYVYVQCEKCYSTLFMSVTNVHRLKHLRCNCYEFKLHKGLVEKEEIK